ncbi:hypothetical protein DL96DRAFT_1719002 [Flagelloscypha sp. PMI_526]|nr:hypothetical protein DL96DRAFT_1719002 [Flagelloscypha sp. PMI_526]
MKSSHQDHIHHFPQYQNALHLIVAVEHRPNWQDWGGRWIRRTSLMKHIRTVLEDLDMRYTLPVQPVLIQRPPGSGPPGAGGSSEDLGNAGFFGRDPITRAPTFTRLTRTSTCSIVNSGLLKAGCLV